MNPSASATGHGSVADVQVPRAWRACAAPAAAALVSVGVVATLAVVDPNRPGHYPTCPFLWLTGMYCPGCGSLRALHDLAHLDLGGAWGMNPLLVVALPFVVGAWVLWVRRAWTGRERSRAMPASWIVTILVLVLFYWVLRNVPSLAPWLAP
ncbi:DUF2752 domain-containing protein [Cellulomonas sp. HZM]|uniref:DUF2752 domain-containing protein n=1 Tax=Cellulomonas sp. HZM TaxID=1454010 RepID=UPI00049374A7|nr:DUF2752 domain-containing protein [Cellulomonas sp. HZM]